MNNGTNTLWYRQGARCWNEALPMGSGRLGVMQYGGALTDRLSLNEDTLWSGYPAYYSNPKALESWKKAQALVAEGKYAESQAELEENFTSLWSQAYMPLADLNLRMVGTGDVTGYSRALDISTGIHTVKYTQDGAEYVRETLVSAPDNVIAVRLTCTKPFTFEVSLSPALRAMVEPMNDGARVTGNAPTFNWKHKEPQWRNVDIGYGTTPETMGMGYVCELKLVTDGGCLTQNGGYLTALGVNSAVIYIAARTSFNGWNKHPVLDGKKYLEPCADDLKKAIAKGWDAIKADHLKDFTALYNRVTLDLGGGDEKLLPTDKRLYRHEKGESDNALYSLYFNFGRYLTIAASREGTQATNLQGIWNDQPLPPWNCNYTININTEMNYWPTLMVDLPECHEPFIRLVKEISDSGTRTAKEYYGAPGFVSHHNTDIWRMSTPVGSGMSGSASYACWPMSAGWFMRHVWEHYEYTQDRNYLDNTAWPLISQCAAFYKSIMTEDADGTYIISPSTSPENVFDLDDKMVAVGRYTSMSQAILWDVMDIAAKAGALLGKDGSEFAAIRDRVRLPSTGKEGELLEWDRNFDEHEIHHRHISHLYALHPGRQITPDNDPVRTDAIRTSLIRRGDESTGWAMGWRINQWARLRDGDHAKKLLDNQLRTVPGLRDGTAGYLNGGGTFINLFDAHPPFQIDGNYGACAGICEMLLQTKPDGELMILPAKPAAWKKGKVTGLRARGGKTVDIEWDGDEVKYTVR